MVFEEVSRNFYYEWLALNIFFDIVFFLDMLLMTRIEIIVEGVRVREVKEMLKACMKDPHFLFDLIAVLPTDLLLLAKRDFALSRLNRLAKSYRLTDYSSLTDIRTTFPHLFRLAKLVFTCFIIFHWNGCVYFLLSILYDYNNALIDDWIFSWDKIPDAVFVTCDQWSSSATCDTSVPNSLRWYAEWDNLTDIVEEEMGYWMMSNRTRRIRFSNFVKQYGLSFYWSALTLTTLGEQPWPSTNFQFVFETGDTLLGLVIFATIVGDVGNMVTTMNQIRSGFEEIKDGCRMFMDMRKVPKFLQRKVITFLSFNWDEGKMNVDEKAIADFLPPRLYGQLAVHIHMATLRRVKLFEDCEPALLYELILRLELRVYSAGDYICRKGEVGTEMYIVKSGFVEVVSEDGSKVFVRLGEGTVFGELSILNIPGNKNGNRRTANVRSVGFCDLYTLQKDDLWEALVEYPHAKESLMTKGRALLAKDNLLEDVEENPLDFEGEISLDGKIAAAHRALELLEDKLTMTQRQFHSHTTWAKKRLTAIETRMRESDFSFEDEDEGCECGEEDEEE